MIHQPNSKPTGGDESIQPVRLLLVKPQPRFDWVFYFKLWCFFGIGIT